VVFFFPVLTVSLFMNSPSGIRFNVGSGLSADLKRRPPSIGSVITFKFQEVTDAGVPRFPVFLRMREDMTWDEVIENAKTKLPRSSMGKIQEAVSTELKLPLFTTLSPSKSKPSEPAAPTPAPAAAKQDDDGVSKKFEFKPALSSEEILAMVKERQGVADVDSTDSTTSDDESANSNAVTVRSGTSSLLHTITL
jgi:DNA ligase-1